MSYNEVFLKEIAGQFIPCEIIDSVKPLGEGFINDTFTVKTIGSTPDYILQRKNKNIFPDVPAMMDNIVRVTAHLKKTVAAQGGNPEREVLTVINAKDGKPYFQDGNEEFWAVCVFISDSLTYDRADTPELAYKGGVGIGRFQSLLSDFNEPLAEVIKGFHNIRWRFAQWDEAVKRDAAGRVSSLATEIGWIESRREEMLRFWSLVENGTIPMRVSHNDTKLSNILFDKNGNVLCVIDLDTMMSSTSLNDFGDAIRSYTNTGAEDDKDLNRVSMSMEIFRAYTEGYLSERKNSMTESELEWLAFSAKYITYEQVLRFLMDYIDGDTYYRIHYPEHNLVRTHAQFKLLQSMEEQFEQMKRTVKEIVR